MKTIIAFVSFVGLALVLGIVGMGIGGTPNEQMGAPSNGTPNDEFATLDDSPVLDTNYDDSWVANVPDVIGGYRVLFVTTPKSLACSSRPRMTLLAQQGSADEFLSDPLDLPSLRAAIRSIPGVPSNVVLGFTGSPIGEEELAAKNTKWNEVRIREGCIHHSRPTLKDGSSPDTTSE